MVKVAIKTAGINGKNLYEAIKNNEHYANVKVVVFADQSATLINTVYDQIPVVSDYRLNDMYRNGEVDYIVMPAELFRLNIMRGLALEKIRDDLVKLGIKKDSIRVSNLGASEIMDGFGSGFENDFVKIEDFTHLRYLEFPIAYHCNLNCKSCSHFSPLIKEEFPAYEQVERDFYKLKELIPYIGRIRILGGEPLLNKEIDKYILLVKELYPYSEIDIVTNGILIKKISKELLEIIRDNEIVINISVYPPIRSMVDEIIAYLHENGIKVSVSNSSEFMPTFTKEQGKYPFENTEMTCQFYYFADGCISTCMLMHDIKYFNDYFGVNYPGQEAMINIHEEGLTGKKLVKRLKMPAALCDYCSMYKHMSEALAFYNHASLHLGWDVYKKNDRPSIKDWIERD